MVISQLEITMDSIRSLHPLARAWLLDGPLSSHVDLICHKVQQPR
jgi:hypothetical protein